jgi:Flp pilus assembly protein TadG
MSSDDGQVTAFVTVIAVALLALAGLVLDGGLALAAKVRALDAAQAAARVGAQQIDLATFRSTDTSRLDPARAAAAARAFLASAGLDGTASATATTVTVTVRTTSQTQLLSLVGVDSLDVSATATATPVRGVTGPGT